MSPEFLRPKDAAARFGVSRDTLRTWAERDWIGRSEVEGCVFYRASDIADLIASHETRRKIVPVATDGTVPAPRIEPEWVAEFWDTPPRPSSASSRQGGAS